MVDSTVDVKSLISECLTRTRGNKGGQFYIAGVSDVDKIEGNYSIDNNIDKHTKFWQGYCDLVQQNLNEEIPALPISQRVLTNEVPIILDYSLEFDPAVIEEPEEELNELGEESLDEETSTHSHDENNTHEHEDIDIHDFVYANIYYVQQTLNKILNISPDKPHTLTVCYLEQDSQQVDLETQHINIKFKLILPFCHIMTSHFKNLIIPEIIKNLRKNNIYKYLTNAPINEIDKIIDINVYDKPIPLYRSIKHENESPFTLSKIYNILPNPKFSDPLSNTIELLGLFDPNLHADVTFRKLINSDIFDDEEYELDHWLPLFLSLQYWNELTQVKTTYTKNAHNHTPINTDMPANQYTPKELLEVLLPMLNKNRYNVKHNWLTIGKAIFNVYDQIASLEQGLHLYVDLTKNYSTKFTEDDCHKIWETYRNHNFYNEKTIGYLARLDNKEIYTKWHDKWTLPYLKRAIEGTHFKVADGIYHYYWLDFVCSSPTKKRFHQYKDHRWIILDGASRIKLLISREFSIKISGLRAVLANEAINLIDDPDARANTEKSIENIGKLLRQLDNTGFKNSIITELSDLFYEGNEDFNDQLDSNPNLMALKNGIIELTDEYATFRDGLPGDMVCKCSNTRYNSKINQQGWSHPAVKEVMKWMKECFYYDDLVEHFLCLIASTMKSGNSNKIIPILTGHKGNNSKSMLKKMMEHVFGNYLVNLSLELFTQKRSGSGPTPELARAENAKQAWVQEPGENEKFNNGAMKVASGGDSYFARNNNENGKDIIASYVLFIMVNEIPAMKDERAMINRVRIIPCDSTWVDAHDPSLPATYEEQMKERIFKMDIKFADKLESLAPAMLWILIQYYKIYLANGLVSPKSVKDATDKYWEGQNIYKLFINEKFDIVYKNREVDALGNVIIAGELDENVKLTVSNIWEMFKEWHRDNYIIKKCPERADMIEHLEKILGKSKLNAWYGVREKVVISSGSRSGASDGGASGGGFNRNMFKMASSAA